jgi:hypothetical protein
MGRGRRPLPSSFKNQTINNNKENTMKKVLLALLSIALAFTAMQPSQAQDERVLAIIDSAINSNNFPSIIHEVCFTTVKSSDLSQNMSCPNGELFMEGKGAASGKWPLNLNGAIFHGDSMVKAALTVNPKLKIVFIRVHNVTSLGASSAPVDGSTILSALDWINKNSSKYSIDAVSVSMAGVHTETINKVKVISVHPGCTDPSILNPFTSQVSQLNAANIPTFVATGNSGSKTIVGFPACVSGVIGVGALGNATQLEAATNRGPGLDMVAFGRASITKYNGSPTDATGSSIANVVSAASYVNRSNFKTFGEYLTSLPKILIGTASYIRN